MESVGADDQDANQLLSELLCKCRVCGKPDSYTNLFYNINKELLKNLISLLQAEVNCSIVPSTQEYLWSSIDVC